MRISVGAWKKVAQTLTRTRAIVTAARINQPRGGRVALVSFMGWVVGSER